MSSFFSSELLALARFAVESELGMRLSGKPTADSGRLNKLGASFVTLTMAGKLRGCMGSLEARRALKEDVQENARAAAFHDPRFKPVSLQEWPDIRIEVSVLGVSTPLQFENEDDAIVQLATMRQGVILQAQGRRATFLPQVWNQLPDAQQFVLHLKLKAGLPADYWSDELRLWTYPVEKVSEISSDE